MRQAVARHMAQSKREIPHFYLTVEIDMTEAQHLRHSLNETLGDDARITLNDLAIRAAALALQRFPQLNSLYLPDGIKQGERINIGIAVALEEGLVAPALLDCGEKRLPQIARESKGLIERTKAGVLKPEEFAGATFTLTNLGMLGVDSFQAIINPPQAAILALGSVKSKPVVKGGEVAVAEMMNATLSADHRVVDGAQGAQFMKEFKALLEAPLRLLA
jgi:pyruvate dehydrogenase E2 component (dihydrolipoamide acetyltransferase)